MIVDAPLLPKEKAAVASSGGHGGHAKDTLRMTTDSILQDDGDFNPEIEISFNLSWKGKPSEDEHALGELNWKRKRTTPLRVMETVTNPRQGFAFTVALGDARYTDKKGKAHGLHRVGSNFAAMFLAGVDFDTGTSTDDVIDRYPLARDHASFAYPTASHTPQAPRCRLVFCLETPITTAAQAEELQRALLYHFEMEIPDPSGSDSVRVWYGAPGKHPTWIGGVLDDKTVQTLLEAYRASPGYMRYSSSGPADIAAVERNQKRVEHLLAVTEYHYTRDNYNGGLRYHLKECPFNPEDTPHPADNGAAVIIDPDGKVRALCHHARCKERIRESGKTGWALLKHLTNADSVRTQAKAQTEPPPDDDYMPTFHYEPSPNRATPTAQPEPPFELINFAPSPSREMELEDETAPHPFPETSPIPGPEMGWLYDATRLYTELNDSPPELNLIAMLTTAAAGIQSAGVLKMGYEDVRPNVWTLGISPSGSRKSTSAGKARRLLNGANVPDWLFTGSATTEGLVRRLKTQPSTLWLVNEGATLLASHRKKYLQDLKTELCNVFDCLPISRNLANETITAADPRMSILAVTTPQGFADSVELGDWHSGFMARFLYVVPKIADLPPVRPYLLTVEQANEQERVTVAFRAMVELQHVEFTATADALEAWAAWANKIRTAAHLYEHETVQTIAERAPTMALKLAMILAACRREWGTINGECMAAALGLADFFLSQARAAMHTWEIAGADLSTMQKLLHFIYSHPPATTGPMRRAMNLPKHKIDACLRELANRGAVTTEEYEYQPGKKTTRYTAVYGRLPVR